MTPFTPTRRGFLAAAIVVSAFAGPVAAFEPETTECIAPANPGGGWDFTCRQVGKTLQELGLIPGTMQVTNLAGGGGGVAFAQVVNKRNEDNNLIVAASSATATRLAQGAYPGNTMDQVRWLATVGADYGIIAVARDSADQDASRADGSDQGRPDFGLDRRRLGGRRLGSPEGPARRHQGGHRRRPHDQVRRLRWRRRGGDAAPGGLGAGLHRRRLRGQGLRRFRRHQGDRRPRRRSGSRATSPASRPRRSRASTRSAPTGAASTRRAACRTRPTTTGSRPSARSTTSPEWKTVMAQNGLAPLDLRGPEFQEFVAESVASITDLSRKIGLIK